MAAPTGLSPTGGTRDPHEKEAQPTAMRALYTTQIERDTTSGWILLPAPGLPPNVEVDMSVDGDTATVEDRVAGEPPVEMIIPLAGPTPPAVKAPQDR